MRIAVIENKVFHTKFCRAVCVYVCVQTGESLNWKSQEVQNDQNPSITNIDDIMITLYYRIIWSAKTPDFGVWLRFISFWKYTHKFVIWKQLYNLEQFYHNRITQVNTHVPALQIIALNWFTVFFPPLNI